MAEQAADSSEALSDMEKSRKRHCWECLRRRRVCDFTHPVCKRCSTSGVVCPGYDDKKPIRWLAPGRVLFRSRKPRRTSPDKIENISKEKMASTSAELFHTGNEITVPRFQMRTQICAVLQASEYYNTCIYQDLVPLQKLGPNPHIYRTSTTNLHELPRCPEYLRLSFVCMVLSHRINRIRTDPGSSALVETFYRYRGLAIRSLNEDINVEHKRTSDIVIAGMISFLLADAEQGASPNWRFHLEGAQKLVALRGGIRVLVRSKNLESVLQSYIFFAVLGNTTCPASDLAMTSSQTDELDFVLEQYRGGIFRFQTWPPHLFAEIVKINDLRMRTMGPTGAKDLTQEAYQVLDRINDFAPEEWAQSKLSSKDDWMLLGYTYQTALALYCILSMQSLSVLPTVPSLIARRTAHGMTLYVLLKEALSCPSIKRCLIWPLVVLGVEAVNGDAAMRGFVEKQLLEMSHYLGAYAPLTAKHVLDRFWASGETTWDVCFDRPYVFTSQLSVDMRQILS